LRIVNDKKLEYSPDRDKGGRVLAKKQWRTFWFSFEVAVESPGNLDEEEAAEDAAEFASTMAHTKGRVHESFCSVIGSYEHGRVQPQTRKPNKISGSDTWDQYDLVSNWEHPQEKPKEKPKKAKPKKAVKKIARY
jgi:hypothetical protein